MKLGNILFLLFVLSLSAYPQVPLSDNMPANGILGAADFITNTDYSSPTAGTLAEPFSVAIDPTTGKLFVADRDNDRVLRWSSAAKMINGSDAEAVFGQADFVTGTSNTGGLSAATMNKPQSVWIDANGTLWVADRDNHRVLRFNNASTKPSGSPADGVLGQPDFVTNTAGTTDSKMSAPASLCVDLDGCLWVADRANNRILRFDVAATKPNGGSANGVLGQSDFLTSTSGLSATNLNAPWGVHADVFGRVWIADRNNSRVLRFDNAHSKPNGGSADGVLGQTDFVTGSSDLKRFKFTEPRGSFLDGLGRLYVGDEGNSRVLVFNNAAAKLNGANADYVIGQPDFTTILYDTTIASSLSYPSNVFIDNVHNHIWIPDTYNHRVLRYDVSPLPVEMVSFSVSFINGKVQLSWSTATEINNSGFSVERRSDGEWTALGFVKGNGTSSEINSYSFIDNASAGKYQYRLKQIDNDGSFEYSSVVDVNVAFTAEDYKLNQNYPNPFNPSTNISFTMQNTEYATLTVHNMLGEVVETLFSGTANANEVYSFTFDSRNLSSGIYFYSLRSATRNEIRKMTLMK